MSSQEQISCLESILESLNGFTDEGEIYTFTNMQNMLQKFSKVIKKHIDEKNIPLLVTCCLNYVDFLLQSPEFLYTTHLQHRRCIHNYFSVLGDIGMKVKLKDKFLKEIAVPLLERIIDPSISRLCGRELARNFNRIAQKSNRELRNEIVNFSARIYIYKLTDLIITCGDYEYQTCLVETLFRMCSSDFIFKNIKEFFPGAQDLQQRFLDIKVENVDRNLRRFLNAVNCVNKKVFSIVASTAYLDEYILEPPVTNDGYDMDLWVDFNVLSCTIGIFCNKNSFVSKSISEEDEWELLTFFVADISFVELKWEKVISEESPQLSVLFHKNAPCHYIFYTSAEAASANVLKLMIQDEVVSELKNVLLNMFGEKFEVFKEITQNSEISTYYTPELSKSVTTNHINKRRISSDGHSERSYANVLLCRNVENKEDNVMSAHNINIGTKVCEQYSSVSTNDNIKHLEENKKNVKSYSLLDLEGNSMVYFSCKENEKPKNDWYYFSSEFIGMQNLIESRTAHGNIVKISEETDLVVEQNKSEKLDSSTVKVVKPKKPRQKKQIKKIKISLTKRKTKINKNVELPLIEEMPLDLPLDSSAQITKNEKEVCGLPNNFNPESFCEREILIHESEILTHESKSKGQKKSDVKQKNNIAETSPTTIQEQNEASNNKQKKRMNFPQEEDSKENLLENSNKKLSYEEQNQTDLRKKQSSFQNVINRLPIVIVERSNFEEYLKKDAFQYSIDKEQTCINTEEIDDISISSSIFNVTTQKSEREDLDKTSVDLAQENNESRQEELTQMVFENVAGKKQNESSTTEHHKEIFEPSSLLNITETELKLNEINFNQPHTVNIKSKKRKLHTVGDLSYLETMKETCSTDSEIAAYETIVTKALIHQPVHYTFHHKQNQIIIKKIKNNVNHKNLDSINIIEDITHCDKKQANFKKENVNDEKMQSTAQEKVHIKVTEKSSPSNKQNTKQCYLPIRKRILLPDENKITAAEDLFTNYLPSKINDNKPKKEKRLSDQISKSKYTSGKIKQRDLENTVHIDSFNDFKNDKYVEMYIEYTSCFDKTSKMKQKSTKKQKSKYNKGFSKDKQLKLNNVTKRKTLDYSDATSAKQKRVLKESSRKQSKVTANRGGNDEVSEMAKQKVSETAMTDFEVKSAKTRVKILQNIVLQPATNSTIINSLDEEEYVQNNDFANISQKPLLYDIDSWLQRGEA